MSAASNARHTMSEAIQACRPGPRRIEAPLSSAGSGGWIEASVVIGGAQQNGEAWKGIRRNEETGAPRQLASAVHVGARRRERCVGISGGRTHPVIHALAKQ